MDSCSSVQQYAGAESASKIFVSVLGRESMPYSLHVREAGYQMDKALDTG